MVMEKKLISACKKSKTKLSESKNAYLSTGFGRKWHFRKSNNLYNSTSCGRTGGIYESGRANSLVAPGRLDWPPHWTQKKDQTCRRLKSRPAWVCLGLDNCGLDLIGSVIEAITFLAERPKGEERQKYPGYKIDKSSIHHSHSHITSFYIIARLRSFHHTNQTILMSVQ